MTILILFRRFQWWIAVALFLFEGTNKLHRSVMRFFLFHNNVLGLLMRETWLGLVCLSPRVYNGLPRSIIHRFASFPLLRRPSFVILPLWVACWVRAFSKLFVAIYNGLHRSIIFLSFRTPEAQNLKAFLPRAFWRRRWQSWGSPCNKALHRSRFCCDSFSSWMLLRSFRHLILNKHKRWFHSSRVKFPLVSMSASWFFLCQCI